MKSRLDQFPRIDALSFDDQFISHRAHTGADHEGACRKVTRFAECPAECLAKLLGNHDPSINQLLEHILHRFGERAALDS